MIIPLYTNTHIWHFDNRHVCFPNCNARRHISAVSMDRVCHEWYASVDVPPLQHFLLNFPPLWLSFHPGLFDCTECVMCVCVCVCMCAHTHTLMRPERSEEEWYFSFYYIPACCLTAAFVRFVFTYVGFEHIGIFIRVCLGRSMLTLSQLLPHQCIAVVQR